MKASESSIYFSTNRASVLPGFLASCSPDLLHPNFQRQTFFCVLYWLPDFFLISCIVISWRQNFPISWRLVFPGFLIMSISRILDFVVPRLPEFPISRLTDTPCLLLFFASLCLAAPPFFGSSWALPSQFLDV